MFFLRIAEALIANQETNRLTGLSTIQSDDLKMSENDDKDSGAPQLQRLDLDSSVFQKEASAHGQTRDRANSIDGHILRSLISLDAESEASPKGSSPSLSPVESKASTVTMSSKSDRSQSLPLPVSSDNPFSVSCSSSPTAKKGVGGGLLYSLLVCSDSQNSSSGVKSHGSQLLLNRCFRSPNIDNEDISLPTQRSFSRLEHEPNDVKKYKVSPHSSGFTPRSSRDNAKQRFAYPPHYRTSPGSGYGQSNPVLRRFSFGGYSAPRSERISAILKGSGPATAPTSFQPLAETDQSFPICAHPTAVDPRVNFSIPSQSEASKVPSSSSTPSILSALIASPCLEWSPGVSSASTDSGLDEPLDLTGRHLGVKLRRDSTILNSTTTSAAKKPKQNDTQSTDDSIESDSRVFVQLAKKTARPVQARVTEWLRFASEFVAASAESVTSADGSGHAGGKSVWLAVFRAIWHRLLACSMAEHCLDVVVVESAHSPTDVTEANQPSISRSQHLLNWLLTYSSTTAIYTESTNGGEDGDVNGVTLHADRRFANTLITCLNEIRAQKLTPEEFNILRQAILLTAEQPLALPALGVKLVHNARSIIRQPLQFEEATGHQPHDNEPEELGSEFGLSALARGLVALSDLSPQQMASLFCSHLVGEVGLNAILPASFRSFAVNDTVVNQLAISIAVSPEPPSPVTFYANLSSPPYPSPSSTSTGLLCSDSVAVCIGSAANPCKRDSILGSLIQNSPMPKTKLLLSGFPVYRSESNM